MHIIIAILIMISLGFVATFLPLELHVGAGIIIGCIGTNIQWYFND